MNASVRPYAAGDLEALLEIEQASFPSAWSREVLTGFLQRADSVCSVLELEERVVGFVLVVCVPDGLELCNLAIAPEHRRRGAALRALEHVDALAAERGADRITLEVRETNLAAQLLYSKAGYRAVGILPKHYATEDGYRMVKHLAAAPREP